MKTKIIILIFALSTIGILFSAKVHAADLACNLPPYVPAGCTSDNIKPDFSCIDKRLLDPTFQCCINTCTAGTNSDAPAQFAKFDAFGTTFRINPSNVPTIVNLLLITALGIISIYALLRGIYVAGFKRTQATTPEDIAKLNQELTNLVLGFIICWAFIIVIQVVANVFGIGKLTNLDVTSAGGGSNNLVITIN